MTPATVTDLVRNALMTSFWIGLPVLAAGFVIGIVVSLAQILTSIQDSSFSTVPRLTVFLGVLLLSMPWMLARLVSYTGMLFSDFSRLAH